MKIWKNEEGVSPVIGVILMVAITVILAAIIAGVVLPMASRTTVAPSASIVVVDKSATADTINLTHRGGDNINLNDVKMVVSNATRRITYDNLGASGDTIAAGDELGFVTDACGAQRNGVSIVSTCSTAPTLEMAAGDTLTVKWIHIPSAKEILSTDVYT